MVSHDFVSGDCGWHRLDFARIDDARKGDGNKIMSRWAGSSCKQAQANLRIVQRYPFSYRWWMFFVEKYRKYHQRLKRKSCSSLFVQVELHSRKCGDSGLPFWSGAFPLMWLGKFPTQTLECLDCIMRTTLRKASKKGSAESSGLLQRQGEKQRSGLSPIFSSFIPKRILIDSGKFVSLWTCHDLQIAESPLVTWVDYLKWQIDANGSYISKLRHWKNRNRTVRGCATRRWWSHGS